MNVSSKNQNEHKWEIEMEADISAAAAVTATRGTNVTCVKSGTATYTFTIKGTTALKMYAVMYRSATLHGTPAAAFTARVTSITQATDGSDDITVVAITTNSAGTETATTGACTLSVKVDLQTARMGSPF
jgi:hypothetical protein